MVVFSMYFYESFIENTVFILIKYISIYIISDFINSCDMCHGPRPGDTVADHIDPSETTPALEGETGEDDEDEEDEEEDVDNEVSLDF
jgi:hypothetical protein